MSNSRSENDVYSRVPSGLRLSPTTESAVVGKSTVTTTRSRPDADSARFLVNSRAGVPETYASRVPSPEVEHFHGSIGPQFDVGRLQIAVDDVLFVGSFERLRNLTGDAQRFVQWNRALRNAIRQGRAVHQLHHEGLDADALFDAVQPGDVGMIERGKDFRLALEAGQPIRISGDRGRQHFDRDMALQARVGCAIPLAHATGADRFENLVRAEARTCDKPCHRAAVREYSRLRFRQRLLEGPNQGPRRSCGSTLR